MAGQPVRNALIAAVDRAGGWQVVIDRHADGESWLTIAESFGVSRSYFLRVMNAVEGNGERVSLARTRRGEALADRGEAALERPATMPVEASANAKKADYLLRLAGVFDPMFRDTKQVNASISLGDMHLDALRARKAVTATAVVAVLEDVAAPEQDEVLELPVEVVSADVATG